MFLKQFKEQEAPSNKLRTTNKSSRLFKGQAKVKQDQMTEEAIEILVAVMSKYLKLLVVAPINSNKSRKHLNLLLLQVLELMSLYIPKSIKPLLTN